MRHKVFWYFLMGFSLSFHLKSPSYKRYFIILFQNSLRPSFKVTESFRRSIRELSILKLEKYPANWFSSCIKTIVISGGKGFYVHFLYRWFYPILWYYHNQVYIFYQSNVSFYCPHKAYRWFLGNQSDFSIISIYPLL